MERLKSRLNRIETKLHPPGEPVIITGSSTEEVDRKMEEFIEGGGDPHATIIRIVAAKINKRPKVRHYFSGSTVL